jgi:hypothetical protein
VAALARRYVCSETGVFAAGRVVLMIPPNLETPSFRQMAAVFGIAVMRLSLALR